MSKVYKVVQIKDGNMISIFGEYYPSLSVEYKIGQETKPKVGALFAFRELRDAKCLLKDETNLGKECRILECECEEELPPLTYLELSRVEKESTDFWETADRLGKTNEYIALCSSITPLL